MLFITLYLTFITYNSEHGDEHGVDISKEALFFKFILVFSYVNNQSFRLNLKIIYAA